ncbi:MAG: tRNA threonylcarbamoyladenosine dehydratase [Spirochaetales bacterium]|nr:tRNA threonylcarbamoyladenosine dehydratase [Spirochaetales bacterium]
MEKFSRTEKLIGKENILKLQNTSVIIFGAGAVGSFAAEALVRSGIGKLTIVDFDVISESNINRQLFALSSTIGLKKTDVAVSRLKDINKDCEINKKDIFVNTDTIPEILSEKPDIILDAIDSVGPKIELLAYAVQNNIPIFSSMGAARRTNPMLVKTGDLFLTANCPLARLMRKALRKRGITNGITCVYSEELPVRPPKGELDEDLTASGHSQKVLGSLPTVTGIFGLMLADAAIKYIIGSISQDI